MSILSLLLRPLLQISPFLVAIALIWTIGPQLQYNGSAPFASLSVRVTSSIILLFIAIIIVLVRQLLIKSAAKKAAEQEVDGNKGIDKKAKRAFYRQQFKSTYKQLKQIFSIWNSDKR